MMNRLLTPDKIYLECQRYITQICETLITQEKYQLDNNINLTPNFEALNHIHPLLNIIRQNIIRQNVNPNYKDCYMVLFEDKIIGQLIYDSVKNCHVIVNKSFTHFVSTVITTETFIELDEFMNQIIEIDKIQLRRLEKVLFCFVS